MFLSHANALCVLLFFLYPIQCVWLLNEDAFFFLRHLSLKISMKGVKLSQVQFIAIFDGLAYLSFILSLVFSF